MFSCREASRLQSDRLDRRLRLGERLALEFHLLLCRACSQAERQLDFLKKAMSELGKRRSDERSPRR
jgi:hypothetical protein